MPIQDSAHPAPRPQGLYAPPRVFGPDVCAWATDDLRPPQSSAPGQQPPSLERIGQFAAGRRCAARALEDAGCPDGHVGVGDGGAPVWPEGYVGSIAHSKTLAWAAVASARHLRGIGIDCEPLFDEVAMRDVFPAVTSERERRSAQALALSEFATVVFAAKESLYKCLYPHVRRLFDFVDVEVESVSPDGEFRVRLVRDLGAGFMRGAELGGRYAIERGHVHSAIELGAGERASAAL